MPERRAVSSQLLAWRREDTARSGQRMAFSQLPFLPPPELVLGQSLTHTRSFTAQASKVGHQGIPTSLMRRQSQRGGLTTLCHRGSGMWACLATKVRGQH